MPRPSPDRKSMKENCGGREGQILHVLFSPGVVGEMDPSERMTPLLQCRRYPGDRETVVRFPGGAPVIQTLSRAEINTSMHN
jgi:hypothetical protein